jgi:hypothetical protein
MRVRIAFYCPRCGSIQFRPSVSRWFRDSFLSSVGVHPHRCYICRRRFYLFRPNRLWSILASVDRPLGVLQKNRLAGMDPAPETVRNQRLVSGDLFRTDRF